MRTNDLCAGFLARDAGKRFPGLWFRRVAGQSSEAGVFLYGEITRLTCEKARLCRVILLYDNGVNKGMIAQSKQRARCLFQNGARWPGSCIKGTSIYADFEGGVSG